MGKKQIVFFGSSPFSVLVLEKLVLSAKCQVLSVVTTPDKPVGRHLKLTPNPVKVLAQKYNLPVYDKIHDFIMTTNDYSMTIGLVAAYGRIIGPKTLSKLNNQIYGIHPSLLPKYRGPSPLQQQILDGITETGVTIFKTDLGEDTGPIVAVAHDKVLPNDTTITLGNRLFEKGTELFIEIQDSRFKIQKQNHSGATYTKKLTRQDGFVDYQLITNNHELEKKRRAFFPWPGVWTINPQGKRIKLDL